MRRWRLTASPRPGYAERDEVARRCDNTPGRGAACGWTGFHEIPWITTSLILFTISGLIWVGILLRLQRRMLTLSEPSGRADSQLSAEFFSVLHQWYAWGTLATVLPIIALYLMVNKPTLW